jgi:hypothetical protein
MGQPHMERYRLAILCYNLQGLPEAQKKLSAVWVEPLAGNIYICETIATMTDVPRVTVRTKTTITFSAVDTRLETRQVMPYWPTSQQNCHHSLTLNYSI